MTRKVSGSAPAGSPSTAVESYENKPLESGRTVPKLYRCADCLRTVPLAEVEYLQRQIFADYIATIGLCPACVVRALEEGTARR